MTNRSNFLGENETAKLPPSSWKHEAVPSESACKRVLRVDRRRRTGCCKCGRGWAGFSFFRPGSLLGDLYCRSNENIQNFACQAGSAGRRGGVCVAAECPESTPCCNRSVTPAMELVVSLRRPRRPLLPVDMSLTPTICAVSNCRTPISTLALLDES